MFGGDGWEELIDAHRLGFVLSCHRRREPRAKNPVRGDLSIGEPRPTTLLFVFQRRGGRAIREAGQTRAAEKQKEGGGGWVGAINRPPLTGFELVRNGSANRGAQRMWVRASVITVGPVARRVQVPKIPRLAPRGHLLFHRCMKPGRTLLELGAGHCSDAAFEHCQRLLKEVARDAR